LINWLADTRSDWSRPAATAIFSMRFLGGRLKKGKSMLCKSFSPAGQFINETNTELSKES
jgi:hypothetical protein